METLRADGVYVDQTTTEEIDGRVRSAQISSVNKTGGILGWAKEYSTDSDRDQMRSDFLWMRREIDRLRGLLSDAEYALESKS